MNCVHSSAVLPITTCSVLHCSSLSIRLGSKMSLSICFFVATRCCRAPAWPSSVLDDVYEAAGEQPGPAVPLQRAFEPAVLSLPVHKHNVSLLQFQLCLALGRIRHHHPVPGEENRRRCQTPALHLQQHIINKVMSEYLSHIMGRASWCWDRREEQGWRGGGAMGAQPSRGLLLR